MLSVILGNITATYVQSCSDHFIVNMLLDAIKTRRDVMIDSWTLLTVWWVRSCTRDWLTKITDITAQPQRMILMFSSLPVRSLILTIGDEFRTWTVTDRVPSATTVLWHVGNIWIILLSRLFCRPEQASSVTLQHSSDDLPCRICRTRTATGTAIASSATNAADLWSIGHLPQRMTCCCASSATATSILPSATRAWRPSCQVDPQRSDV